MDGMGNEVQQDVATVENQATEAVNQEVSEVKADVINEETSVETDVNSEVANAETKEKSIAEIIEEWFQKHFHGVFGLETSLYNQFHDAKEELKTTLGDK